MLTERPPLDGQPGMAGTGVMATSIRRYTDQFINRQLTTVQQNLGRLSVSREELFRLQNLFGDSNNQGIAARMNDFFRGLQDVSIIQVNWRPLCLVGERQTVGIERESKSSDLVVARQSLNFQVRQTVTEINNCQPNR